MDTVGICNLALARIRGGKRINSLTMERLIARPSFGGAVVNGGRYVIVDDVLTMGGTLSEMANHIRENGGEVIGTIVLANASRTPNNKEIAKHAAIIEERFGDVVRDLFGVEPAALTAAEAAYLKNFRDADQLRSSATAAQVRRSRRLRAKGLRTPEAEGRQLEQTGRGK